MGDPHRAPCPASTTRLTKGQALERWGPGGQWGRDISQGCLAPKLVRGGRTCLKGLHLPRAGSVHLEGM